MRQPSSCRGVLIAGVTNTARTQMAEAFLRHLSGGRVPVHSAGVHLGAGVIDPLACSVMAAIGVPLQHHSVCTLAAARRHQCNDVVISIDAPYGSGVGRETHRLQQLPAVQRAKERTRRRLHADSNLYPATPAHWSTGFDATDARQRVQLWSPADPRIAYETSTRKFQDHLYEGEPLFMRLELSTARRMARLSVRWEMAELSGAFAAEREAQRLRRFLLARDDIHRRCVRLLRRLEAFYEERLLVHDEEDQDSAEANAMPGDALVPRSALTAENASAGDGASGASLSPSPTHYRTVVMDGGAQAVLLTSSATHKQRYSQAALLTSSATRSTQPLPRVASFSFTYFPRCLRLIFFLSSSFISPNAKKKKNKKTMAMAMVPTYTEHKGVRH
eukprot:gene10761-7489_t